MKKCLPGLLFFLLALPLVLLGQGNEKVIIEGSVVDADSLQPLPYVHVKEKSANVGTVTGVDGKFTVSVNARDTIVFSIVGYQSYSFVPADTTPQSLGQMMIKMVPRTYVLKEVKVKDYRDLTKYLQPKIDSTVDLRRPQNIRLFEEKEPQKKNAVHTVIPPGMQPAQLAGAVTAFANLFNDEFQQTKKLNKILEIEEEDEREQQIKEAMTEKFQAMVSVVADLDNAALKQFTTSYMPSPYLMLEMNDYEIMEGIMQHITAFEIAREKERISLEQKLKNGVFEDRDKIE